jgi:hypothetical protein
LETYGAQRYHLSQTDQWKNELRVWTSTWEPREETDHPSKDPSDDEEEADSPSKDPETHFDTAGPIRTYGSLVDLTFPDVSELYAKGTIKLTMSPEETRALLFYFGGSP